MRRKFIGITMQHSINKCIAIVFMTVFLISCSHIAYMVHEKDQTSKDFDEEAYSEMNHSPRKTKYKQIYCTPKDQKEGVKATIDFLNVPCGLSEMRLIENRTLKIKRIFLGAERLPSTDILLGHHLLILKSGNKILQEIKVEKEDDPFWKKVLLLRLEKVFIGKISTMMDILNLL